MLWKNFKQGSRREARNEWGIFIEVGRAMPRCQEHSEDFRKGPARPQAWEENKPHWYRPSPLSMSVFPNGLWASQKGTLSYNFLPIQQLANSWAFCKYLLIKQRSLLKKMPYHLEMQAANPPPVFSLLLTYSAFLKSWPGDSPGIDSPSQTQLSCTLTLDGHFSPQIPTFPHSVAG